MGKSNLHLRQQGISTLICWPPYSTWKCLANQDAWKILAKFFDDIYKLYFASPECLTHESVPQKLLYLSHFLYPSPSAQVGFMTLLRIAMVEYLSMFWKHYEWTTIVLQKLGFLGSRLHSRLNGQIDILKYQRTYHDGIFGYCSWEHPKSLTMKQNMADSIRGQYYCTLVTSSMILKWAWGLITLVCFNKAHIKYHVDVRDGCHTSNIRHLHTRKNIYSHLQPNDKLQHRWNKV